MDRPRIALVLDKPQRDLPGLVLLALELCAHGAECFLVPATLRRRELFALAPDFTLLYNLRLGFEGLVRDLLAARIGVGVLDTEGGVWPEMRNYTELLLGDAQLRRQVAPFCAWGPDLARHLVGEGFFAPEQVVVTGCPRFDFYHDTWRAFDDLGRTRAPGEAPPLLVVTNFSEANPGDGDHAAVARHLEALFGWPRERVATLLATQHEALAQTVELIAGLASAFPRMSMVVRPHPFEGRRVYEAALDGLANVTLNATGPVMPQIRRSMATVQRTSTTALESAMAGVPALAPLWIPAVGGMPAVEAVSTCCANEPALHAAVAALAEGRFEEPPETRARVGATLRGAFGTQDGTAYRRVADALLRAVDRPRTVDVGRCRQALHDLSRARRVDGASLGRLVRYALRLTPEWSFRDLRARPSSDWLGTDSAYSAADVSAMAAHIRAAASAGGRTLREVGVWRAREHDEYLDALHGHSVKLAPAA